MGSGVADIPDSVARALLDALQEKRIGNQLPAAMAPLARIRASQLQKCIANGTEPQGTIIQAALDLIALGKGPSGPAALSDKVSMVSQMPDVQTNATLPAQDSSSTINTTACAEVTTNPLYQRGSTIGEGGDAMISSPGRSPKQPLPGMRLHDPLHGLQACPKMYRI